MAEAADADGHSATRPTSTPATTNGVGYFHVNQKRGLRWSAARGFLKPVLNRPNLRLETGVLVERLMFEGGRAVGVRFSAGGEIVEARARGEVILSRRRDRLDRRSCSAPASGRPTGWARSASRRCCDQPGVGRNLQDHLQQRAIYKVERRAARSTRPITRWSAAG